MLGEVELAGGRRHAEQLAPAIEYLCRELDVDLDQLAAIAVGLGPGLFTGLRVGVTTAKVMAQALRIPVVGIPSLDLVAYPLRHSRPPVVAVLDARRQRGLLRALPAGARRRAAHRPSTRSARPTSSWPSSRPGRARLLLAGDGARGSPTEFAALDRVELAGPGFAAPSVAALVELATARAEREEFAARRAATAVPAPERRRDRVGPNGPSRRRAW